MFGPRAATLTHVTAYLRDLLGLALIVGGIACGSAAVGMATSPPWGLAAACAALAGLGVYLALDRPAPEEGAGGSAAATPIRDDMIA